MSSSNSGIPWFKIAMITAVAGVSCLAAGYAAMNWSRKPEIEAEEEGKSIVLLPGSIYIFS